MVILTAAHMYNLMLFTIQNGYTDYVGGGIYCSESSPTISHSVITSNIVDWYGGGVYCERSNLTMSNVVISNNEAQQGSAIKFANPSNDPSILTFNNVTITKIISLSKYEKTLIILVLLFSSSVFA